LEERQLAVYMSKALLFLFIQFHVDKIFIYLGRYPETLHVVNGLQDILHIEGDFSSLSVMLYLSIEMKVYLNEERMKN